MALFCAFLVCNPCPETRWVEPLSAESRPPSLQRNSRTRFGLDRDWQRPSVFAGGRSMSVNEQLETQAGVPAR